MALGATGQGRRRRYGSLARLSALSALSALLACGLVLGLPAAAHAHGAVVGYEKGAETVQVKAAYDTGEPMEGAQVAVYAPAPGGSEPWVSGTTDTEGRFFFAPDTSSGEWTVEVRKAGHGETIEVPVRQSDKGADDVGTPDAGASVASSEGAATAADQRGTGFGPLQIVLMAALGVWGLIGTALYFARRRAA